MLNFGNKEFRNLQEQVYKNMQDIANIEDGTAVLSEFGIKVVGEVDTLADLPSVIDYKSAHADWEYGDAFAIGTEAPYTLVILTRANDEITADHWFDIGDFPAPGPQGQTGPQGEVGPQGPAGNTGDQGADAGFGSILATAQTLPAGSSATATVTASGPNTAKELSFTFGLPRGADGDQATWGNIHGTLSEQTDLDEALDAKQDALVSGTNIKTVNNQSLVGSGNIEIVSGVWGNITGTISDQTDLNAALAAKQDKIDADHKLSASLIYGLSTVATTGDYDDLSDKPTIGAGTITLKKNGDTVDSFGVNQTADQNINITVPTKTSDLSNDSDFADKTYVDTELATELATKQDVVSDLAAIRSGAAAGATAVQPADIANMVTTNTSQTITGTKTLSDVNSISTKTIYHDYSGTGGSGTWATTAINYNSDTYQNGPELQVYIGDEDDSGNHWLNIKDAWEYRTGGEYEPGESVTHICIDDGTDEGTESYLRLPWGGSKTSPRIIATTDQLTWSSISNKPSFATVATSGSYNDLSDKPTIPTTTSELTNDSGFITSSAVPTNYVTTDTAQTISGAKTFSGSFNAANSAYFSGGTLKTSDTTNLEVEKTLVHAGWQIQDGGSSDYKATYFSNGVYIEDIEEKDEDAPYYLGFPNKSGILAVTSDIPTVPTNYVTTDTAQTISGAKTFSSDITMTNCEITLNNGYWINLGSGSGLGKAYITGYKNSLGSPCTVTLGAQNAAGSTISKVTLGDSIMPSLYPESGSLNLGTSSYKWNNLYLSGNITDGTNTVAVANIADKSNSETWTFTLDDDTVVTKTVVLG